MERMAMALRSQGGLMSSPRQTSTSEAFLIVKKQREVAFFYYWMR